jgi:hypothetical protein
MVYRLPSIRFERGPCCHWMKRMLDHGCILESLTMDDHRTITMNIMKNGVCTKRYVESCPSCGRRIKLAKNNDSLDPFDLLPKIIRSFSNV